MKKITSLLFLLLLIGCSQSPPPSATPTQEEREAVLPQPTEAPLTNAGLTILADGVVQLSQPALPLSFETNGTLLELVVQVGDEVQAGQLLARLDDSALQDALINAQLQVAQAENSLAQAQADLDKLLTWEADPLAVAVAEANLLTAETQLANAEAQDAAATNNLTSVNVQIAQAQRSLDDAQEAYDVAHDPGRDWELGDPWRADALKAEREGTARAVQSAQEQLQVAYANYAVQSAGLNDETAVSAQASVVQAQQALAQAQQGPKPEEILAAELRVEQAGLTVEQNLFSLQQAQDALAKAELVAPWSGTVLSVDVVVGSLVGSGTPVLTLLDSNAIEFKTTNLSERDLAQIEVGQTAVVTLKSYPNDPIEGTVLRIGLQAEGTVGDAATFPVLVGFGESELIIRQGMTGRVEIR